MIHRTNRQRAFGAAIATAIAAMMAGSGANAQTTTFRDAAANSGETRQSASVAEMREATPDHEITINIVRTFGARPLPPVAVDDSAAWRAISSGSDILLDEAIARLQRLHPDWTPGPDLGYAIARHRTLASLRGRSAEQAVSALRASGLRIDCQDPELLWMLQDAEAATDRDAALNTLRAIVGACPSHERLTAIKKAWGPYGPQTVVDLIAIPGAQHPQEQAILEQIRLDSLPRDALGHPVEAANRRAAYPGGSPLPTARPAHVPYSSYSGGAPYSSGVKAAPPRKTATSARSTANPSTSKGAPSKGALADAEALRKAGDPAGCIVRADAARGVSPMGSGMIAGWCEMDRSNWRAALGRFDAVRLNKSSAEPDATAIRIEAVRAAAIAAANMGDRRHIDRLMLDPQIPALVAEEITRETDRTLFLDGLDGRRGAAMADNAARVIAQGTEADDELRLLAAWRLYETGRCSQSWYAFREIMTTAATAEVRRKAELGFRASADSISPDSTVCNPVK